MTPALLLVCVLVPIGLSQTHTMTQGARRMELMLERRDGADWRTIDPGLVLAQGDRVRFRFRTNFDGYLYVMNQSTSGKYEQLFPREETGQDNRLVAGREYQVPATSTVFRIAGPPGHEIVYWLVTPARLTDASSPPAPPPERKTAPLTLIPRCDDAVLRARGDCIDSSAGPKTSPARRGTPPEFPRRGSRDLMFMRQKDTAVISSREPLNGPILYEFDLAHR